MEQNNNKKQVLEFLKQLGSISDDSSDEEPQAIEKEAFALGEEQEPELDNRFDNPQFKLPDASAYIKPKQNQEEPHSIRNLAVDLESLIITDEKMNESQNSESESSKLRSQDFQEQEKEQQKQMVKPSIRAFHEKAQESNIFSAGKSGLVIGREARMSQSSARRQTNPNFGRDSFILGCGHEVRRRKMDQVVKARTQNLYFTTKADKIGEKLVKCPYCFYILKREDIEKCFETEEECKKHLEDANLRVIQKLKEVGQFKKKVVKHDQECLLCDADTEISALDNDHWLCKKCWKDFTLHYWSGKGYRAFDSSFKFDPKEHQIVCPVPGCRFNLIELEITKEIKTKLYPKKGCSIF